MAKKPEDNKQDDQMFEDYLQGGSSLSGVYRAEGKVRPPVHLDKAILSAANEAVKPEQISKVAYSPFARNWYVPASMAAVLMLCVGLVFTIYQDSGQTLLAPPKSEYDIDAQVAPMKFDESGEKNRQDKYVEEIAKEAEMPVHVISEENKPAASSIEAFDMEESDFQQRPASRMLLREKVTEMDDALLPETVDEMVPGKDASDQTMRDSLYSPERLDDSGRREAAKTKKQKQLDVGDLDNKLGKGELKTIEQGIGVNSDQEMRYRQTMDDLQRRNESLKEESFKKEIPDDDQATVRFAEQEKAIGDEMMTPEQWLKQINNLWASGEHQAAEENLKQFFEVYPDYSIENIKTILDPQIDLMEYIR